jgi:alkylation response protein AidB-like acyl-CoA dehydrogenase
LTPHRGGWTLEGRKYYSTGALYAQWLPITALDEEGRRNVVYIPRDTAGVEIIDDWNSMGQRGTASGTIILDNVFVPRDRVVALWQGEGVPAVRMPFSQIMHAAMDIGIAEEALADTVAFIQNHSRPWHAENFAKAGDDPHRIRQIGELSVRLEAARALLWLAADTFDNTLKEQLTTDGVLKLALLVASAKAAAASVSVQISSDLFSLAGTSAADEKHNLHRHWRNARTHTLHDPEVWKYHYIGDYVLNGREPPKQAMIV